MTNSSTLHFIIKEDGKLYLLENVPEEPKPEKYGYVNSDNWTAWYTDRSVNSKSRFYKTAYRKYEQALQRAKDNGVEVVNKENVIEFIQGDKYFLGLNLEVGTIYTLTGNYSAEIKTHCNDYHQHTKPSCLLAFIKQQEQKVWNELSHVSGYPRAFDGSKTYRITFETISVRDKIEPLLTDSIKYLPDGYAFELTEGLNEYVAKVVRISEQKKEETQEQLKAELQRVYKLVHYWSQEAHMWRDAFVSLSRFDPKKHLFSKMVQDVIESLKEERTLSATYTTEEDRTSKRQSLGGEN